MEKGRERKRQSIVFFSNRIESLIKEMQRLLFSPGTCPFEKRMVIVPNNQVKSFLSYQFAKDIGIASGVQVLSLSSAIAEILSLDEKNEKGRIPSSLELSLRLEEKIKVFQKLTLSAEQKERFAPLLSYLEDASEARLLSFCDQLSLLFLDYGKYGGKYLSEWCTQNGWQQDLWHAIFSSSDLCYLQKRLEEAKIPSFQIHLIGFNFLPKAFFSFFKKLGSNFFLLSPCQFFWGDLCSDKERVYIHKFLRKQKIKESCQLELDIYFNNQNSFLANLGRLGRQYLQFFEQEDLLTEECYEEFEETTLLRSLQNDLLLLRASDSSKPMQHNDISIQVHAASSKRREVEILSEVLHFLLDKHKNDKDPILLKDILVLSPDITDYAAYIQEIFEEKIPFTILDDKLFSESPLFSGLKILFSLVEERFSVLSFLRLFSNPIFLEKFSFSTEDCKKIRKWIEHSDIHWGVDSLHRKQFLQNAKYENDSGTWEKAWDNLLESLILIKEEEELFFQEILQWEDAELLGNIISILRSLKEDLSLLIDKREKKFSEWVDFIEQLSQSYFAISVEEDPLFQNLKKLSCKVLDIQAPIGFESFKRCIDQISEQTKSSSTSSNLQTVQFASLLGSAALSAKVICLLGMEESAFPRQERRGSLCEISSSSKTDPIPSVVDEDRYLFLENLISAKDYFIIFYANLSNKDLKEQSPSLVVLELLSYLDKGYQRDDGEKVSKAISFVHPSLSFDKRYFSENALWRSYSQDSYLAALAYYGEKKEKSYLIPSFYSDVKYESKEKEQEIVVDIKKLAKLAKHPIQFYFENTLGIYLREDSTMTKEEEEFILSHLRKSTLRKASIRSSISSIFRFADERGILPAPPFKEVAFLRVEQEVKDFQENLASFNLGPADIFSIELKASCTTPIFHDNKWTFPPLFVPLDGGRRAQIIGKISEASQKGLLFHGKNGIADLLKAWPAWLIFSYFSSEQKWDPSLLLTKDGKMIEKTWEDSLPLLAKFIDYYETFLCEPSPLMPSWADAFFEESPDKLEKRIDSSVSSSQGFEDQYIQWLFRFQKIPDPGHLIKKWLSYFETIFSQILEIGAKK